VSQVTLARNRSLGGLESGCTLACLAVQVHAEAQSFSAFFVPMAQLTLGGDRYSIPMTEKAHQQSDA
jgi:hypothetical protein